MQADLPHTLFKRNKTEGTGKPPKNTKASDKVIRLQEEANRKAEERRKARKAEDSVFTLEELFEK